jgi:uncharacterized membrane protein YfcA
MFSHFDLPSGLTPVSFAALALIMASSGLMSGLSGFGFSAIGAISLSFLPPALAVPLLMALSTTNQLLSLRQLKADMKPLHQWWPSGPGGYILGGALGAPVGLWLLQVLPVNALMVAFGVFLMLYAAYSLFKPAHLVLRSGNPGVSALAVGALGGLLGGFTAFPGAAVVVWTGLKQLPKAESRAIVQPYILAMQVFSLALLAVFKPQAFGPEFMTLFLLLLPVVLPCTLAGTILYRKISDFNFRRIAFLLLGSSGLGIFIKGAHAVKLMGAFV